MARQLSGMRAAAGAAVVAAALIAAPGCAQEEHGEFVEVVEVLQEDFVDRDKLSATEMERAGIEGLLEYLDDPYTSYLSPERFEAFNHALQGNEPDFEGVGASVTEVDGQIIVLGPLPGSPAFHAGLMAGDVLVSVDGTSIEQLTLEEVVALIRGPKGTEVLLGVSRAGISRPVEIPIVRDTISVSSVHAQLHSSGFGYIRLSSFDAETGADLQAAIADLRGSGAEGLVLDLRNNGGGLVNAAVDVVSEFVPEGPVLRWTDADGNETVLEVSGEGTAYDLPLVVLVNGFSASASEVVSGALQDHERARIVGTRTFGKGAVNLLHPLESGAGLNLTVARWLTPDGRTIEGDGIEPDVRVGSEVDVRAHGRIGELTRDLCAAYEEEAESLGRQSAVAEALDTLCDIQPESDPASFPDEQLEAAVLELSRMTGR
ncbi:MAG: S41 family peptidase [Chloroflexota bacterium]|nr:S41 family peptidase [Chloroflexota bacterium]MDE2883727.1 S41 family peptidase [Chloroflexota bacterium]